MGKRIASDLGKRIKDLQKAMRRARKQEDSEAVHDTRVASRRLDAALSMWGPYLPARRRRPAVRSLRDLRRSLGETRDLEVHHQLLAGLISSTGGGGNKALRRLARRLYRRMEKARLRSAGRLRRKRRRQLVRRFEQGAGPLLLERGEDPILRALELVNTSRDDALALLDPSLRGDDEELRLHQARIVVKKWRYGLECLRVVVPDRFLTPADPLREIQERLGEIHDLATLRSLLARRHDRLERKGRRRQARSLRDLAEQVEQERVVKIRAFLVRFVNLRSSLRAARVPPSPWAPLPLRDEPEPPAASAEDPSSADRPRFQAVPPVEPKPES
jgi:CHAD domain-containing protein